MKEIIELLIQEYLVFRLKLAMQRCASYENAIHLAKLRHQTSLEWLSHWRIRLAKHMGVEP